MPRQNWSYLKCMFLEVNILHIVNWLMRTLLEQNKCGIKRMYPGKLEMDKILFC